MQTPLRVRRHAAATGLVVIGTLAGFSSAAFGERPAPSGRWTGFDRAGQVAVGPRFSGVRQTQGFALPELPLPSPTSPPTDPGSTQRLPFAGNAVPQDLTVERDEDGLSVLARNVPVGVVLTMIAEQYDLNVVAAENVTGTVTVALYGVPLDHALDAIVAAANATWVKRHGILMVSAVEAGASPGLQGRVVRVFPLDYASAADVGDVVAGLLSPVGKSFVSEVGGGAGGGGGGGGGGSGGGFSSQPRTRETLVVEDLPDYVERVAEYLAQVDRPPRQVLIEAHVLQVDLESTKDHGVDWRLVGRAAGLDLRLQTTGFSGGSDASPGLIVGLGDGELDNVLTALKRTRDAKTLASPKVLVVDGNDARIQVGGRFGYLTETTTETSTVQNVEFLEVGVVLNVTPRIAADGRVMLNVRPEISDGEVDANTGLPEEETTEVESTVLLHDGRAMILGGLIQEADSDRQQKVIGLGDLKYVGRLFGQRNRLRDRAEIIVAVLPRVVPYDLETAVREQVEIDRVETRLFEGPLHPQYRPWEPKLPDAIENPKEPLPKASWLRWPLFGKRSDAAAQDAGNCYPAAIVPVTAGTPVEYGPPVEVIPPPDW
ncbi:MAG: secretin N-terminal domain-containing protein [Planctomycetota bacterium]